ncbi:MAG TPA: hypothetical protein VGH38_33435 [Bryobacteraceae bacterium]
MNIKRLSLSLFTSSWMLGAVYGQIRPNFTGAWEFVCVERDGMRITFSTPGNTLNKETQIFAHQEPNLKIKMLLQSPSGLTTLDLQYTTDGKTRPVGVIKRASGVEDTVDGSARWEGDRLIYEQGVHDSVKEKVFHVVRSLKLEKNGTSLVADQVTWLEPGGSKSTAKWFWEKKQNVP